MIVKLLLEIVKGVLLFIIGLFPALPDMSFLVQPLTAVTDLFVVINSFVSVRLVGFCLSVLVVFANIDFIWSIIMWVVRKIPGVE